MSTKKDDTMAAPNKAQELIPALWRFFHRLCRSIATSFRRIASPIWRSHARTGLVTPLFGNLVPRTVDFAEKASVESEDAVQPTTTASMLEDKFNGFTNLVDWTLSGAYDSSFPVLLDAADQSRCISKRKAEELISSLAGAFEAGSTVCLHLANDVTYPILVLGILASRCRWTGTNPAYTSHELTHHFRASQTKYVVVHEDQLSTVQAALEGPESNVEVILFADILRDSQEVTRSGDNNRDDTGSLRTLDNLMQAPDLTRLQNSVRPINKNDIAALASTSGTTGMPKMAARTHNAMIMELAATQDNNSQKPYEVRRLISTPIFHAFTTPEVVFNPLRLGYPTYIMKRFDSSFAQKIHDFGITETAAAPPVLKRLTDTAKDHALLQALQQVFCGGAPLAPAERERFLDIFAKPPRIVQVWGMTEGGWFTTFKYPEDDATGSVGRPIPGYEVRVLPNATVTLEHGQPVGELLVKGPQLMTHYFGDEAATAQTFTQNGWLETGDVGYVADGKVYVTDRVKDLIKVHAFQVAPAELEQALLQSPLVADAGVCAAGHADAEHPALFVVRRDVGVTREDVKGCLAGRLASYKVKYGVVYFVDTIPKSPTGKILRKELRRMVEGMAEAENSMLGSAVDTPRLAQ